MRSYEGLLEQNPRPWPDDTEARASVRLASAISSRRPSSSPFVAALVLCRLDYGNGAIGRPPSPGIPIVRRV